MNPEMRRTVIAGNWKMNFTPDEATAFINEIKPMVAGKDNCDIIFCAPFVTITAAMEAAKGSNKIETYLFAAAVNAEGKIVAASSDCVEATFEFDATGKTAFDASAQILSKKEKGDNYGMTNPAYGGTATKEWYEQAAAFDAACLGKTASEVAGLMGADYKGTADVQAAGCTIYVSGFVKAASKIG